jgi:hypothetical protein
VGRGGGGDSEKNDIVDATKWGAAPIEPFMKLTWVTDFRAVVDANRLACD